jgi:hypothetical protein
MLGNPVMDPHLQFILSDRPEVDPCQSAIFQTASVREQGIFTRENERYFNHGFNGFARMKTHESK